MALTVPVGMAGVKKTFGDFKFTELSKGWVQVDHTWEAENLVTVKDVCGTGLNVRLHRLVIPVFEEALKAAMTATPKYKVRMLGGFASRHKMNDPKRGLSIHSWGAAVDINWDKNPVSSKLITDLPKEFVAEFTKRGWDWGGSWKGTKDAMHFQYATGV